MKPDPRICSLVLLLASGCASYDGAGLVPGQSNAAQVEQAMGQPRERVTLAGGDTVWFYPVENRITVRHNLFVQFSSDGIVREVVMVRSPLLDKP